MPAYAPARHDPESASKAGALAKSDALFFRSYTCPWLYLTRPIGSSRLATSALVQFHGMALDIVFHGGSSLSLTADVI
jgi:hypothetical protein